MKRIIFIITIIIITIWLMFDYTRKSNVNESLEKLATIKKNVAVNYPSGEKSKYLVALQLHRWDIAIKILTPLAESNDPDAIYWLTYISGENVFSGSKMAEGFAKSAKLGNIYGALQLSPGGRYCSSYLRGICKEKWLKVAEDIYNEENNRLSILDKYYFKVGLNAKKIKLDSEITNLVYDNANVGNYQPLVDYIRFIKSNYALDNTQRKLVKEILSIPISHNHIPSLTLAYYLGEGYQFSKENIIKKLSSLTVTCAACQIYYEESVKTREALKHSGSYYIVGDTLKNSDFIFGRFKRSDLALGMGSLDIRMKEMHISPFSKKEIKEIKENALKILNNRKVKVNVNKGSYNS